MDEDESVDEAERLWMGMGELRTRENKGEREVAEKRGLSGIWSKSEEGDVPCRTTTEQPDSHYQSSPCFVRMHTNFLG